MMTSLPHAHILEFIFVGTSCMGLMFSFFVLHRAFIRLRHAKKVKINGFLLDRAETDMNREIYKSLTHALMLTTGIAFLFMAPPVEGSGNQFFYPQTLFGLVMWIVVSGMLTFSSFSAYRAILRHNRLFDATPFNRRSTDIQEGVTNGTDSRR